MHHLPKCTQAELRKSYIYCLNFTKKIMTNYFVSGLKNRTICVNNAVGTINDGSKI